MAVEGNQWVAIVCAVCITVMVCTALLHNINGTIYTIGLISVAGLGGFKLGEVIKERQKAQDSEREA